MVVVYDLEVDVINSHSGQQGEWPSQDLVERIKHLRREADANQWLFGPNGVEAIYKIGSLMMDVEVSSDIKLLEAVRELNLKVDNELHMSKLRRAFL